MRSRQAMEFPTQEALEQYLKDHPGADPANHSVAKGEGKEEGGDEEHEKKRKKLDGDLQEATSSLQKSLAWGFASDDIFDKSDDAAKSIKRHLSDKDIKDTFPRLHSFLQDQKKGRKFPDSGKMREVAGDVKDDLQKVLKHFEGNPKFTRGDISAVRSLGTILDETVERVSQQDQRMRNAGTALAKHRRSKAAGLRSQVIRLAASLPKGDPTRRALLNTLCRTASYQGPLEIGDKVEVKAPEGGTFTDTVRDFFTATIMLEPYARNQKVPAVVLTERSWTPRSDIIRRFPKGPEEATLKVGDILVSSWGYDQTNIDFYEVVGTTGKMATLRKLEKKVVRTAAPNDYVVPIPRQYAGPAIRRKIGKGWQGGVYISINTYAGASLWDGKPEAETRSEYGH